MFNPGKALGRALIGSLFVYGGQNTLRNSEYLVPMVEGRRAALKLDALPLETTQLVQIDGVAKIALGGAMALGIKSRLAAVGLLPFLCATTLAAHDFWNLDDPQAKNQQMTAFFGNLGAAGGLITVAATKN